LIGETAQAAGVFVLDGLASRLQGRFAPQRGASPLATASPLTTTGPLAITRPLGMESLTQITMAYN